MLDLTSNSNPFGPSKRVRNALRKAIKKINKDSGREKDLLIKYMAMKCGVEVKRIVFFSSLPLFLKAFFSEYSVRSVGLVAPVSKRLKNILERVIASSKKEILVKAGSSLDDFSSGEPIDLLFLIYPHDVVGAKTSLLSRKLLDWALSEGVKIIIDETFLEFLESQEIRREYKLGEVTLVKSFSEFYGLSGLDLFCVCGGEEIVERLRPHLEVADASILAYCAVRTALKDKKFRDRTLSLLREEKKYVIDKSKKAKTLIVEDTGSHILLIKSPHFAKIDEILRRKGILVDTYLDQENVSYIRFPLKKRRTNALFIKTLLAIVEPFEKLPKKDSEPVRVDPSATHFVP
ncbi:MAG: hypothetical protein NZ583_02150 [Desulfobacterota bacterium]|nr:hypothetical protein [Thermodesulfobacteriota bacterium]